MQLIVGLGNPGDEYAKNRHNVGFAVLDAIAGDWSLGSWKKRFQGQSAEGVVQTDRGSEKVLLLKPWTYYNETGRSVSEATHFYGIDSRAITVFHDELDLAPGKFRLKTGGGHAGNRGLRSMKAHIAGDFRRGRIGIGHPGDRSRVTGWVLGDFSKSERVWLEPLLEAVSRSFPLLLQGREDAFQTKVTRLAPALDNAQMRRPTG